MSKEAKKQSRVSMPQYSALAPYYEELNSEVDYSEWTNFLTGLFEKYCAKKPELVLELACGTGAFTRQLADRGYDMIGIDISDEMLAEASRMEYENDECDGNLSKRRTSRHRPKPLYLCQDIRSFELYGTVNAAICCLDGINYLTGRDDLDKCFSSLHTYLEPGGIFIFDVNTPYKFENVFGNRDYILESDNTLCAWQNSYDSDSKLCDFYLSIFTKCDNGSWTRSDEYQSERCYSRTVLTNALKRCGFELLTVLGDRGGKTADDSDERWYFIARRT